MGSTSVDVGPPPFHNRPSRAAQVVIDRARYELTLVAIAMASNCVAVVDYDAPEKASALQERLPGAERNQR